MRTLGVLVAGGRGRRLGLAAPKALATLGGRTFLERTRAALAGACDDVVLALPAGLDLPLGDATRVDDAGAAEGGEGPLAGLIAGLASRPFDRAFALGVDYPLMTAAVIRQLFGLFEAGRALGPARDGLLPMIEGRPQPLAAVYAPSALAPLSGYFDAGGRGLMGGVDRLRMMRLDEKQLAESIGPDAPLAFANVNTPEDLAVLEHHAKERSR